MNLIRRGNTPLAGFRPGTMEDQFGRMVESMFQDFFAPLAQGGRMLDEGLAVPRLDVSEHDQAFEIQAELPGVKKEDIKVSIDGARGRKCKCKCKCKCRRAVELPSLDYSTLLSSSSRNTDRRASTRSKVKSSPVQFNPVQSSHSNPTGNTKDDGSSTWQKARQNGNKSRAKQGRVGCGG